MSAGPTVLFRSVRLCAPANWKESVCTPSIVMLFAPTPESPVELTWMIRKWKQPPWTVTHFTKRRLKLYAFGAKLTVSADSPSAHLKVTGELNPPFAVVSSIAFAPGFVAAYVPARTPITSPEAAAL